MFDVPMPEFAWPYVALCLPLPWLLRRLWRPAALGQAMRLPYPGLPLQATTMRHTPRGVMLLAALAWLCLVAAAMRPQWVGPPQSDQRSGRAMMLAVDLSGSMRLDDMVLAGRRVSRFGAVEAIASDFIARRTGDEMGLVLFGSGAYAVTPLTYDLDAVRAQLQSATVGLAGGETAIGDAVAVASKRLAALPEQQRVLILLTDGVNNTGAISPRDATRVAKAQGVRVYTIGIGATRMSVPGFFGSQVINPSEDLDENLLRSMAQDTGGRYFRATDTAELADAYRAIDALEPMPRQGPTLRPRHELFRAPLLLSILLFALALLPTWRGRRDEATV